MPRNLVAPEALVKQRSKSRDGSFPEDPELNPELHFVPGDKVVLREQHMHLRHQKDVYEVASLDHKNAKVFVDNPEKTIEYSIDRLRLYDGIAVKIVGRMNRIEKRCNDQKIVSSELPHHRRIRQRV